MRVLAGEAVFRVFLVMPGMQAEQVVYTINTTGDRDLQDLS
jgi:hypothetical protein